MDGPPLAHLSITHVNYVADDPISHLCAYLALVPQALMVIYLALLWSTREVEILLMFAGQMGNEALNWSLKRLIQEERPTDVLGKGYGMPSSHAQFAAFFATFLALFLLLRHQPHARGHPHASHTHLPTPLWQRGGLALLAFAGAAAVAQSRVYLRYHTPRQVAAGFALGVLAGAAWFVATGLARRWGWVDWALEFPPARWVRLRDLVVTEDPIDAGWARWEAQRERLRRGAANGRKIK